MIRCASGSSAARLARSVRDAEVGGSNPLSPTGEVAFMPPRFFIFRGSIIMPKRAAATPENPDPRRTLPSVNAVIQAYQESGGRFEGWAIKPLAQREIDALRLGLTSQNLSVAHLDDVIAELVTRLRAYDRPKLEPMLNGTGVIIHTNLGRAQVSPETADAMAQAAASSVTLELDRDSNQ